MFLPNHLLGERDEVGKMVLDEGGEFLPTIGVQMDGAMDVPGVIERPEVVILHDGSQLATTEDVMNQSEFFGA